MNPRTSSWTTISRHLVVALGLALTILTALPSSSHAQINTCALNGGVSWKGTRTAHRPVFSRLFYLQQFNTYTFETREASFGADPVMRLVSSSGVQVAMDDDSGVGDNARIQVQIFSSGFYALFVHGTSTPWGGTNDGYADLYFNGTRIANDFEFSGEQVVLCGVETNDLIQTAFEPQGPDYHQTLVISGYSSVGGTYQGHGLPSKWEGASHHNTGIKRDFTVFVGHATSTVGRISVVRNDALRLDSDEDGLGNGLEDYLGTCRNSILGHPYCFITRPTDTDDDGLSDYEEVFGVLNMGERLPFRLWGANPLHKDVFVELDHPITLLSSSEDLFGYMNRTGTISTINNYYLDPTRQISNPDGVSGIRFHFDVRGASSSAEGDNPVVMFDGGGSETFGNNDPACSNSLQSSHFSPSRVHYFHWGCINPGGGGNGGYGKDYFTCAANGRSISHELGHNFGLDHGGTGPINGNPIYPSLMNYTAPITYGFSTGQLEGLELDTGYLCEIEGILGAPLDMMTSHYLSIRTSSDDAIDWNRNGIYESCNLPAEAPANWTTIHNDSGLTSGEYEQATQEVITTPELASLHMPDTWNYAFYTDTTNHVRAFKAHFPGGACSVTLNPNTGSGCLNAPQTVTLSGISGRVLAATRHTVQGFDTIFLAVASPTDQLEIWHLLAADASGGLSVDPNGNLFPFSIAVSDAELANFNNQLVVMLRRKNSVALEVATMNNTGVWSNITPIGKTSQVPVAMAIRPTSTGGLLYALHSDESGLLKFIYSSTGSAWASSNTYNTTPGLSFRTTEKPALAWRPFRMSQATEGHWRVAYVNNTPSRTVIHAVFDKTKNVWISGWLKNQWFRSRPGTGVDLLYDPQQPNLRGAVSYEDSQCDGPNCTPKRTLNYFPFVDGHARLLLHDVNDWAVMNSGVCRSLWAGLATPPCGVGSPLPYNGYNPWLNSEDVECE